MNFEKTSVSYKIPLTKELDVIGISNIDGITGECLAAILDEIEGVSDSNYDGHFGNFIYITLDTDNNNAKTKKLITKAIENHFVGYSENKDDGFWYLEFETITAENAEIAINEFIKDTQMELKWFEDDDQSFGVSVNGSPCYDEYKYKIVGNEFSIYYSKPL